MADRGVRFSDYIELLRENRNMRLLWLAQLISEMGNWFYSVAIFSFILQVSGTAQSVAFAFTLQVLPQVLAAPTAGVINDRVSRRQVMMFADWMRVGIVALMLLVRSRDMLWLLYILLFCETVMWSLFEPASSAVMPNIVEEKKLVAANALGATTWSFSFAVGSAIGGIMAAVFGLQTVLVFDSLSFACSALLIRRMRFEEPHAANLPPLRLSDLTGLGPVGEGLRYLRRDGKLLATVLMKASLSIMGVNWVLLPVMGQRLFPLHMQGFDASQSATMGMSILLGARGVGALIGGMLGARVSGAVHSRMVMVIFVGLLCGVAGYVGLAAAPNLLLACAALVVAHAGGSAIWTSSTAMIQEMTDDKYRGRVFSAALALSMLTLAVVNQLGGWLLDHGTGMRALALWTGLALLIPAALWRWVQVSERRARG